MTIVIVVKITRESRQHVQRDGVLVEDFVFYHYSVAFNTCVTGM